MTHPTNAEVLGTALPTPPTPPLQGGEMDSLALEGGKKRNETGVSTALVRGRCFNAPPPSPLPNPPPQVGREPEIPVAS